MGRLRVVHSSPAADTQQMVSDARDLLVDSMVLSAAHPEGRRLGHGFLLSKEVLLLHKLCHGIRDDAVATFKRVRDVQPEIPDWEVDGGTASGVGITPRQSAAFMAQFAAAYIIAVHATEDWLTVRRVRSSMKDVERMVRALETVAAERLERD